MTIEIEVNGRRIKAQKGMLLLDLLNEQGINVPTLCNMQGFKPSGACRLCVVEIDGCQNLVPSCSFYIEEPITILTHSAKVLQARKAILELLLSNHDDDCLFCDRSKWCKLQDLAAELNITERKSSSRPVRRKIDNTNPSIFRDPAKCILCSRCVRVCEELQQVAALDFLNRGSRTVVGTVLDKGLNYSSCISCGQCIQVCPTGALKEKSHLDLVGIVLRQKVKIPVALVDPSVFVTLGEYYGFKPGREFSSIFINALKRTGFQKIYRTGWGIEYQAGKLADLLLNGERDENSEPWLLSECPSVVRYISQSRPDLLSSLIPLKSGKQMMSQLLRKQISMQTGRPLSDISIINITSCTAAKNETCSTLKLKEPGAFPDYSLTTREVYRLIRLYGIQVEQLAPESQEDYLGHSSGSGHLSAFSGGYLEMLIRIILARYPKATVTVEKVNRIKGPKDLKEITIELDGHRWVLASLSTITQFENYLTDIKSKNKRIDLIEVMACPQGCINGGGQPYRGADRNLKHRYKGIIDWDEQYSGMRNSEKLEIPNDLNLQDEDFMANFVQRLITK